MNGSVIFGSTASTNSSFGVLLFSSLNVVNSTVVINGNISFIYSLVLSEFYVKTSTITANGYTVFDVSGPVVLQSSSVINATASGYPALKGLSSATTVGTGGAHGGRGGQSSVVASIAGTTPYGDLFAPLFAGSGGYASSGGGIIRIKATGSIVIDGIVTSNGATGCGTGAGGSIWISGNGVSGNGRISANGGRTNGPTCGAGGGGRVAVYGIDSSFAATVHAMGGVGGTNNVSGSQNGAAGTVFISGSSTILSIDNGNKTTLWPTILLKNTTVDIVEVDTMIVETEIDLDSWNNLNLSTQILISKSKLGYIHIGANSSVLVSGYVENVAVQVLSGSKFAIADSSLALSTFSTLRASTIGLEVYPN